MALDIIDLGTEDYREVWDLQRSLVDQRAVNKITDTLVMVEHQDVVTLGRRGKAGDVLRQGLPVYEIERGGEATYHGPGQLVCYPIIHLGQRGITVPRFVRMMEEVIIRTVTDFGIESSRVAGKPGVWVDGYKLASIGVSIRHWVTFHGFALNVNTNLSKFDAIRPCGMDSSMMTSMERILGQRTPLERVKERIVLNFVGTFNYTLDPIPATA